MKTNLRIIHYPNFGKVFVFFLSILLMISMSLSGCRNRGAASKAQLFIDHEIAQKLPTSTDGFLFFDFQRPAFQKYREYVKDNSSPQSFTERLTAVLEASNAPEISNNEIVKLVVELSDKYNPFQSKQFSNMMYFWGLSESRPFIDAGLYADISDGKTLAGDIKRFRSTLEAQGAKVEEITGDFLFGLKVTPQIPESLAPQGESQSGEPNLAQKAAPNLSTLTAANGADNESFPIFIAVASEMLSITSSEELLKRAFAKEISQEESGAERIKKFPSFQRVREEYNGANEFAFMYTDVDSITDGLANVLPKLTSTTQPESISELVNNFPLKSLAMRLTYNNAPGTDLGILLEEKSVDSHPVLSLLGGKEGSKMQLDATPRNAVFYISFAGRLFKMLDALLTAHPMGAPENLYKDLWSQMKFLQKVSELSIGVLPADGASFLPSLIVSLSGKMNSQQLVETIKAALRNNAQQLPVTNWNSKEILGSNVEFLLTPMGIGLYLTAERGRLLLATSEIGMRSLLAKRGDASQFVTGESLPGGIQERTRASSPLVFTYFNSKQAVQLIKSVEASLSMFTGGQQLMPPEQLQEIERMGTSFSVTSYRDGFLNVSSALAGEGK